MNSNLRRDYFWNTLGVLSQNAISPLLLVAVTRINGIDDSGIFSFAFAVSVVLWTVSLWGGRTYQVSDAAREFSSRGYIAVRVLLGLVVMLAALMLIFTGGYTGEKALLILILTLLKVVEAIADGIYGVLQIGGKLYISGISLLLKSTTGLLLFVVVLTATSNLLLSATMLLIANLTFVFLLDIPKARRLKLQTAAITKQGAADIARESLVIMKRSSPVFAMSLLAMLAINIPRYFVDRYHESEIGYFGILAMPITLLTLLITFILQPNIVGLSRLYAENKLSQFHKTVLQISRTTFISIGLILGGTILFGVPALNAIFGLRFETYEAALIIIILGAAANTGVGIMTNTLTVMRQFKGQFFVLLLTNTALIPLCLFFVPKYGLNGAVVLYSLTCLLQVVVLYVVYQASLGKRRLRT